MISDQPPFAYSYLLNNLGELGPVSFGPAAQNCADGARLGFGRRKFGAFCLNETGHSYSSLFIEMMHLFADDVFEHGIRKDQDQDDC